MKHKRTILFSDYKINPPDDELKSACLEKAMSVSNCVKREKSLWGQMKTQILYMGFWFWGGIALVLLMIIFALLLIKTAGSNAATMGTLAILSISGPFLAIISAPVLARSYSCDMWELEEASFFNLPRLSSLRLIICAGASVPPLLLFLLIGNFGGGLLPSVFALLVPFFLSNTVNYLILGRLRGMAGSFCCIGACIVLCLFSFAFYSASAMASEILKMPGTPFAMVAILIVSVLLYVLSAKTFAKKHSLNNERFYNYGN